ncbi:uncharacterized protein LOC113791343 [Dermatophagoides pteronyssinus]|uniref:Ell-associated factor Eaf-like n=1 Tax=Dermatophagoides pteronyssinus TaxID=6956 RepID=A0A6P6XVD2_DERPT|nr:ell-associated factor Eaf-like [Dermatophagoides pteronyssinus]
MGTTGRFGGGGHGLTGPKHIWYDTDYSELYKGLAVVIGFFLFLVLLLLIFILISYLRKWYRLKKRPNEAVVGNNNERLNSTNVSITGQLQHQQQLPPHSMNLNHHQQQQQQHHQSINLQSLPSSGKPSVLSLHSHKSSISKSGTPTSTTTSGQFNYGLDKDQQTKFYKKHSRVGLSQNSSANSSQPPTPLSSKLSSSSMTKKSSTTLINPNLVTISSTTPLPPTLPITSTTLSMTPSANIELIHDPNIVMTTTGAIDGSCGGGGGINPSSIQHHHHHGHYQEFPPQQQQSSTTIIYQQQPQGQQLPPPSHIVSMMQTTNDHHHHHLNQQQQRKDSHSSMQLSSISGQTDIRPSGRSSLATITLS